jgi:hypothetical protein
MGYRAVFPIAGLLGVASALRFTRLRMDERALSPESQRTLRGIWWLWGRTAMAGGGWCAQMWRSPCWFH